MVMNTKQKIARMLGEFLREPCCLKGGVPPPGVVGRVGQAFDILVAFQYRCSKRCSASGGDLDGGPN